MVTGGVVTVMEALIVESPDVAVIVTPALLHCGSVVTGTNRVWLPAGTVTEFGTTATEVSLLLRLTGQPPEGACSPRTTSAVSGAPPGAM
jgi:hypothetical protein